MGLSMEKKKTFFTNQLKKILLEKGMTQKELADKLDVTKSFISIYFNGKQEPKPATIHKIAKALNVSPSYFIEEIDTKTIQSLDETTTIKLPILSIAECGKPDFCAIDEQLIDDFIEVPKVLFPDGNFIVRCLGNSMLPEIPPQAYCIIKKMEIPLNNKNMLIKTTDGFTIKRVKIIGGKIKLYYLNPANKELKVNGSIEIIGKVIGIYQKY
jgi:SOS-response transcriptional repressor LexA